MMGANTSVNICDETRLNAVSSASAKTLSAPARANGSLSGYEGEHELLSSLSQVKSFEMMMDDSKVHIAVTAATAKHDRPK